MTPCRGLLLQQMSRDTDACPANAVMPKLEAIGPMAQRQDTVRCRDRSCRMQFPTENAVVDDPQGRRGIQVAMNGTEQSVEPTAYRIAPKHHVEARAYRGTSLRLVS